MPLPHVNDAQRGLPSVVVWLGTANLPVATAKAAAPRVSVTRSKRRAC